MRSFSAAIALFGLLAYASSAPATEPTVRRPPTYWNCQDDLRSRMVATFLDTDPPSVILERGDKRVIAVQRASASGAKYMASDGVLFWIKGRSAMVEWPAGEPYTCTMLQ